MFKFFCLTLLLAGVGITGTVFAIEDPTKPPVSTSLPLAETMAWPKLQSILFGEERRLALLSDQLYAEGDEGEGFEVVRIFERGVVVRMQGEIRRLSLNRAKIHKEVK